MARMGFTPATVPLRTLSPANDTVQAGKYLATTLSAVDADLAVGNIKQDTNIFGKVGTLAAGTPAEDAVEDARFVELAEDNSGPNGYWNEVAANSEEQFISDTITTVAGRLVVVASLMGRQVQAGSELRIYVDDVEKAASAVITPCDDLRWMNVAWNGDVTADTHSIKIKYYNNFGVAINIVAYVQHNSISIKAV